MDYDPVALVGYSFGDAVVVAAGVVSRHVDGVVSLFSQTYGANMVGLLSPCPLLVVHGKSDTRLPYSYGQQIYDWANQPKQLNSMREPSIGWKNVERNWPRC